VTVTDGESFSGLDFSMRATPPPPNRGPEILSTPPTTVEAETMFRYRPAVTDLTTTRSIRPAAAAGR
jgi:hypothetical protein